jgi:hypothetical protein
MFGEYTLYSKVTEKMVAATGAMKNSNCEVNNPKGT